MSEKFERRKLIGRLVAMGNVTSQQQLAGLLAGKGMTVTQATVSRDLEEMGVVKVRGASGSSVYAVPEGGGPSFAGDDALRRVMREWVLEVDSSANLVVVRTPPGCAHVVAAALDRAKMESLLGTVAGDDTILVVARERSGGGKVARMLEELAGLKD